jgi:hypothetical protein
MGHTWLLTLPTPWTFCGSTTCASSLSSSASESENAPPLCNVNVHWTAAMNTLLQHGLHDPKSQCSRTPHTSSPRCRAPRPHGTKDGPHMICATQSLGLRLAQPKYPSLPFVNKMCRTGNTSGDEKTFPQILVKSSIHILYVSSIHQCT